MVQLPVQGTSYEKLLLYSLVLVLIYRTLSIIAEKGFGDSEFFDATHRCSRCGRHYVRYVGLVLYSPPMHPLGTLESSAGRHDTYDTYI